MAKVFSIHEIELKPGVTEEEFEHFLTTEYRVGAAPLPAGWSVVFMKGNRGKRDSKYVIAYEVASVEERDRYFPKSGEPSAEFEQWVQQWTADQQAVDHKLNAFSTGQGEMFTDYTVIAT
jgi:hypothetical protein